MQLENLRILVIGDIMVDKYLHGSVERISPEAPVPVLSVKREEYRFGGAGNVAANLAALGCNVSLLGLYGKDEMGEQVRLLANKLGIQLPIPGLQNFTTTVKQRALGNGQQLIRLDYEAPNNSSAGILPNMICESLLRDVDTVILSDYAKGALNNVEELISYFKNKNIRIVVDPKGHCFNKYQLSSVVTPNFSEFQRIVGQCYSEEEIELRARSLMENLCLDALLLTRSEKGVSLFEKNKPTLHIASSAKEIFDVTGAGDTLIATFSLALSLGYGYPKAATLANHAAGMVVGKPGTAVNQGLDSIFDTQKSILNNKILDKESLKDFLALAKYNADRIVFTNGCFDILHEGHVSYLESAKELGNKLIVGINSDKSVKQLKGTGRPINKLGARARMLASLACVDAVISFSEQTPEALVTSIKPDFLVKGGDNEPEKIPGYEFVKSYGGEVIALQYIDGVSTSEIISKISSR